MSKRSTSDMERYIAKMTAKEKKGSRKSSNYLKEKSGGRGSRKSKSAYSSDSDSMSGSDLSDSDISFSSDSSEDGYSNRRSGCGCRPKSQSKPKMSAKKSQRRGGCGC